MKPESPELTPPLPVRQRTPATVPQAVALPELVPALSDGPTNVDLSVQTVNRELNSRADPDRVGLGGQLAWPWGAKARAHGDAKAAAADARLDVFRDDLRAIRVAHEVLSRAATMRAVEVAELAILEIRVRGEVTRLAVLNTVQLQMTQLFVRQLEMLETFRGRVTAEILSALKERAFDEFTERMQRASRTDIEFNREELLALKQSDPR